MRKLLFILPIVLLFFACGHRTTFKEVEVNNRYTIEVPDYMYVANDLLPGIASLQYENDSVEVCLIVLDTLRSGMRESSLLAFYDSAIAQPAIESPQISEPKFITLDGDSAYTSEMSGKVGKDEVFYKIEVVATADRYYQILMWVKNNNTSRMRNDMEKVLTSFHDINHKKV